MINQNKILRVLKLIGMLEARPPKTLMAMAESLKTTERTIYRYVDLLSEIGFNVGRDPQNRWFIPVDENKDSLKLTVQERELLYRLVATGAGKNNLKDGLLLKLKQNKTAGSLPYSGKLLNAHIALMVEQISSAIHSRHQIVLKKYHSLNSNNISDRRVEPIRFTDDYRSLIGYEIKTGKTKQFNIERISSVETTKTRVRFEANHRHSTPDVFGFTESGKKYKVEWLMSLRVSVLMREEYPMTSPLIQYDKKTKRYHFKAEVNSLKPVSRFLLGFLDEVSVKGDDKLKTHLQKKLKTFMNLKD